MMTAYCRRGSALSFGVEGHYKQSCMHSNIIFDKQWVYYNACSVLKKIKLGGFEFQNLLPDDTGWNKWLSNNNLSVSVSFTVDI